MKWKKLEICQILLWLMLVENSVSHEAPKPPRGVQMGVAGDFKGQTI